jgi:hypothetical protein
MHPQLVKEKISVEKVESMNESSLLLMFSMMEMLHEVPPNAGDLLAEESFSGKGGEFGGAGASGPFDDCGTKEKCKFCDSYKPEQESEPSSNDSSSDSGSSDNND